MAFSDSALWRRCAPYGVAVLVTAIAVAVLLLLYPVSGNRYAYEILLLGVLITAWLAGSAPAVTAVALGALAFHLLLDHPGQSLEVSAIDRELGMVIYLVVGIAMAAIAGKWRSNHSGTQRMALDGGPEGSGASHRTAHKSETARLKTEREYAALVEAVPQIVWTSQSSGAIDFANQRWYEFSGFTPEQTMGDGWTAAVHPDDLQETLQRWTHALRTGEPVEVTYRIRNVNGQYRWQLARGVPIKDGDHALKWFGTLTDIEDQKQAEVVLREEDRRKDEFLATLSHELRNPLAPIRNMLEVLKQNSSGSEIARQAIEVMDRQLRQMVRLIDDLLNVTHIRQGRIALQVQPVELASIISQAVETCRPLAESMNHQLTVTLPSDPICFHGDPARLTQVFGNLLNNACKYTKPGGQITLTAEQQSGTIIVSVRDNGRGIPKELQSRIFQMFTQAPETQRESQGGLGIGLTLARRFVELHGGTVEARSEGLNCGSEFVVRLPVRTNLEQRAVESIAAPSMTQTPLRILVVDDNRDAALSFVMLLEVFGHTARMALNGAAAVDIATTWEPQVLFCDLAMPGMPGTEVALTLSERLGNKTVLVALTGFGSEADRLSTAEAGFNYHLVKPIDLDSLAKLLANIEAHATAES